MLHSVTFTFCANSQGILSYFGHEQNHLEIEGNLKILVYQGGKTLKTWMVKDGKIKPYYKRQT